MAVSLLRGGDSDLCLSPIGAVKRWRGWVGRVGWVEKVGGEEG